VTAVTECPAGTDTNGYEHIIWTGPDEHGVATLTFNRPDVRNAFNERMYAELTDVLRPLRGADDIGAVLVTGAGDAFCAGGDFSMIGRFGENEAYARRIMDQGVQLPQDWLRVRPPIVAAVNGHAMGLGANLALLSDIVVMSERARIGDTHVRAGIVAGDGGALIWPLLVGPNRAKELLMTGNQVTAQDAWRMGLVNHIVAPEDLLPKARVLAVQLATGPRHAIAWTKQAVNLSMLREASWMLTLTNAQEARTMGQADIREGVASFQEGRKPVWPSTLPEA
jgi:enoyl-CoA hydratase